MAPSLLAALALACAKTEAEQPPAPPADPLVLPGGEVFRGHFTEAFESSAFRPCGETETWLLIPSSRRVSDRMIEIAQKETFPPYPIELFVVVRGDTTGRGRYGHLGGAPRAIYVYEVLEGRAVGPDDCAPRWK